MLELRRYYVKHASSPDYEKRVTWIEGQAGELGARAIYEYKGKFPGPTPHGSSHSEVSRPYERLKPSVSEEIRDQLKCKTPSQIYREADPIDGPRHRRQIRQAKYRARKRETAEVNRGRNFADQIQNLDLMVQSSPFVQRVIRTKVLMFLP